MIKDTYIHNGDLDGDTNRHYGGQNGQRIPPLGFHSYGATETSASVSSSTLNDYRPDFPPTDHGKSAWLLPAGCFWLEGLVWGLPFSYGVFETYYSNHELFASESGIPAIGTTGLGFAYSLAPVWVMNAKHVLEIGTLGAYSTIWMASASEDVKVVTIENDAKIAEIARENIRFAGMEGQIGVIVGDVLDVLPRLTRDVEEGKRARFEFNFIDADKANAINILISRLG